MKYQDYPQAPTGASPPRPPPSPAPPRYDVPPPPPPRPPSGWSRFAKALGPLGIVLLLLLKFAGKLKFLILPIIKFLPVLLKTGGTMLLSIWFYAMNWGWQFAVGFVILIFVHECGHLIAAKRFGLKVGAPVFIPFMGAFIALKDAPKDAWMEAWVGIGGPLLGTLGAGCCHLLSLVTGNPLFQALAYTGFFLNLFNLAPIGFLDGGRIVTAISPWLWLLGLLVVGLMLVTHLNILLVLILVMSLPRLVLLFRRKSDTERRFFEVTPQQRWTMTLMYFGLVAFLVFAMQVTHILPPDR